MPMDSDLNRFHSIVRGRIKGELRKFVSNGELVAHKGSKTISIPIPRIDIPKIVFARNDKSGMGQGDGEIGKEVSPGDSDESQQAGNQSANHVLEVDVTLEELASILGEELGLPNIRDKGKKNIIEKSIKYSGVLKQGPESLSHFRRTFREALKRSVASGEYDPDNPVIVPIKDDKRYRSYRYVYKPVANALMVYMMDVSGSMGDEQKEIVRLTSFWLDTWLSSQYKNLEKCYIIHDATAKEVSQDVFYRTKESGGTLISSAYKLACSIVEEKFESSDWNIYLFHFSDGDNWSGNDTAECLQILENRLLPAANLFCYGQVESRYGSGQFLRDLTKHFGDVNPLVSFAQIKDREAIVDALKIFLSKGK